LDKIVVTALLMTGGVILAIMLFNAVYPAIGQGNDAITNMQYRIGDRMKSQVDILHAAQSGGVVTIWIKNTGDTRIAGVDSSDLFFGPDGNFARIPYGSGSPHWEYVVENGTEWTPRATLRVVVYNFSPLSSGRYFIKMTLPNGISDEDYTSW
jgi:archaellum component FlaG (FlaF/FlaG flagellin family)